MQSPAAKWFLTEALKCWGTLRFSVIDATRSGTHTSRLMASLSSLLFLGASRCMFKSNVLRNTEVLHGCTCVSSKLSLRCRLLKTRRKQTWCKNSSRWDAANNCYPMRSTWCPVQKSSGLLVSSLLWLWRDVRIITCCLYYPVILTVLYSWFNL